MKRHPDGEGKSLLISFCKERNEKRRKLGLHQILDLISYHAVYDRSALEALNYARKNGFTGIQLAVELLHLSFEKSSDREISEIASYIETSDMRMTIHAPDETASLFQSIRYLTEGVFNYYRNLFQFAERVKSKLITIHIGAPIYCRTDTRPVINLPDEDYPLYKEIVVGNLNRLLDLAGGRFIICIENHNMDGFVLEIIRPLLEKGSLALCWDLPKSVPGSEVEQYYFSHLSFIKQVHLSDLGQDEEGRTRRHLTIGSGHLDFKRYLSQLCETDILDYCIEVRPKEKAKESMENLKKLLTNDFMA
jgi:sugar phosphate isomerase/epimerase